MYQKKYYMVTVKSAEETVTKFFEDWVDNGNLMCPIEEVIEDWAYTYFDKELFKIVEIVEIPLEDYSDLVFVSI